MRRLYWTDLYAGAFCTPLSKRAAANTVKNGRFFRDMTAEDCAGLPDGAGLEVLEIFETRDVREGRGMSFG